MTFEVHTIYQMGVGTNCIHWGTKWHRFYSFYDFTYAASIPTIFGILSKYRNLLSPVQSLMTVFLTKISLIN